MTIVRWDPFRNVTALQERINRLFDDAFPGTNLSEEDNYSWQPAVDIFDTDKSIIIFMDLPGISKENIIVDIKGNRLTIKGERNPVHAIDENFCTCRERVHGAFQRSFLLPEHIVPEKISAKFKEGVLEIEIPKPVKETPKQISVRVE